MFFLRPTYNKFCLGGSEGRCTFCLKAALGESSIFWTMFLSASSLSPWTLGQHSCSFPRSWIKPLSHSTCWSSSNTRTFISAFRHDKDFDLFIKIFPAANGSASPFHTNMPVQSPLLLRWGADFHARNPALCQIPLFFLELWRYIMMLINSFLKKRIIASIGSNFINVANEGK